MTSQIVNQEVIDAYYEYTHLTLDRRKFAHKLRQMAEADTRSRLLLPEPGWAELRREGEAILPQ